MTIKAGAYFYTSWGYDQTNVDYCVVVEVSSTGKTVMCQMVSPIHIGSEGIEDVLTPGTAYGPVFRMKVKQVCNNLCLKGSYPYISNMPEERRLDCFFPTKIAETHRQTMSQFGH